METGFGICTAFPNTVNSITPSGALPMRELHTHSLVFYQAGHQAFSQLMEGLVGDGLVAYDESSAVFSLTEKGQAVVRAAGS